MNQYYSNNPADVQNAELQQSKVLPMSYRNVPGEHMLQYYLAVKFLNLNFG